jgi:hypothetical protein
MKLSTVEEEQAANYWEEKLPPFFFRNLGIVIQNDLAGCYWELINTKRPKNLNGSPGL